MLKTIKRIAIATLLGVVVQPGQASESAIIDGFTEFLIDRANARLIAVSTTPLAPAQQDRKAGHARRNSTTQE